MYINYGTDCEILNRIIGQVNGTNILLYGHVYNQFRNRISKLQDIIKLKELNVDYLVEQAIKAIEENYDECITHDGIPVWKILHGTFYVCCDKNMFAVEIALLIKSRKVNWKPDLPKTVAEDYKEYIEKGIVAKGDVVIGMETFTVTIKSVDDNKRMNFTDFDVVRELKFDKMYTQIKPRDITNAFPKEIVKGKTTCSYKAKVMYDNICKKYKLK